ncbi:MAG: ethanolamine utilization protein EutH, partial [Clostridia bacterium]|nr:ethanolamine utilization protein EutH [Clostridia bacterium]
MEIITYVMLGFAVIAGLDRMFGKRVGLGAELERGIHMRG